MERQHLGDQIAAILRDAPAPMSLPELGHLLTLTFTEPCASGYTGCCESDLGRGRMTSLGVTHFECLGNGVDMWTRTVGKSSGTLRGELDAMFASGLVTRSRPRSLVLWEWAGESVDMSAYEHALG
ncbi:hypothetical protein [Nocardioides okcheonensis]|uniref:hypothetical protein n=1 Tax=Nocardioides okcheonensis TaxID=2894081 RepID=UPI001E3CAB23|nr:hypothetical protein [Nocardioides okcheonensis]UFN46070.1 hypothetical protein LN652_07680 [Nocardioides okcheonensis]